MKILGWYDGNLDLLLGFQEKLNLITVIIPKRKKKKRKQQTSV